MEIVKTQKALTEVLDVTSELVHNTEDSNHQFDGAELLKIADVLRKYLRGWDGKDFKGALAFFSTEYGQLFADYAAGKVTLPYDENILVDEFTKYLDDLE